MTADVMALKRPERKPFTLVVAAKVRGRMAEQTRLQEDLAALLGMSQQSVSKRLTGKVPFDVNELADIAAWFGLTVAELLGDAGNRPLLPRLDSNQKPAGNRRWLYVVRDFALAM